MRFLFSSDLFPSLGGHRLSFGKLRAHFLLLRTFLRFGLFHGNQFYCLYLRRKYPTLKNDYLLHFSLLMERPPNSLFVERKVPYTTTCSDDWLVQRTYSDRETINRALETA